MKRTAGDVDRNIVLDGVRPGRARGDAVGCVVLLPV